MGRSRLWSISWLPHQMFYTYIMISAGQARECDDLHHVMSPFSLFLSSFLGAKRLLGYLRPWRIVVMHPPGRGNRRNIRGLHLEPSDRDSLHVALWHNWSSNAPLKDADPELRHSKCLIYMFYSRWRFLTSLVAVLYCLRWKVLTLLFSLCKALCVIVYEIC